ncbi:MurR/RpiR family transcriptional regulator [Celeribacter sp. ASW11-22]|nr:MurR/RpiR family transcriptional regulator [Celeribacter litoreus]
MTIRERIQNLDTGLTKAEQRISRVILSDYPVSAMKTLADLGKDAATSPATVLRFVGKLGYSGYPEFQKFLRDEIQGALDTPLSRLRAAAGETDGGAPLEKYGRYAMELVQETIDMVPPQTIAEVVDILADIKRPVYLIGGRYSRGHATILGYGLSSVRGQVREVEAEARDMVTTLADIGRRDIVVVFDFRRYQSNIVHFTEEARAAGARLILFTDRWQSPCAAHADQVIALPVASPSLFDTGLSTLLCVETIVSQLTDALGSKSADRVARIEQLYNKINDLGPSGGGA